MAVLTLVRQGRSGVAGLPVGAAFKVRRVAERTEYEAVSRKFAQWRRSEQPVWIGVPGRFGQCPGCARKRGVSSLRWPVGDNEAEGGAFAGFEEFDLASVGGDEFLSDGEA